MSMQQGAPAPNIYDLSTETAIADLKKVFQAGGPDSDLIPGGGLDEEQQLEMWTFVRQYAVMLAPMYPDLQTFPNESPIGRSNLAHYTSRSPAALVPGGATMKVHSKGQVSGHYDLEYIPDTITRGATEGTRDVDQYAENGIETARRRYELKKLRSSHKETTEFYMRHIQNATLNAQLGNKLAPRMMQDFEDLAINGDESIAVTSKRTRLLKQNDGWLKLARNQSPKFSLGGDFIEWDVFVDAVKMMPEEYNTLDFKWFMHPHLWLDWITRLSQRGNTAEASAALGGSAVAPMGFATVLVPTLPRQQALPLNNTAVPARVKGERPGPISFKPNAKQFSLNVNGAGAEIIVFPDVDDPILDNRNLTMDRIAETINSQYSTAHGQAYANIARVGQHGVLEIVSPSTGAGQSIVIAAAPANDCLSVLLLAAGTYSGAAAGGAGVYSTIYEGTPLLFGPAWNFVWHVSTAPRGSSANGLRMFTRFEQGSDSVETDIYTFQDATLYAPEALILVDDIRVARAGTRLPTT